MAAPRPKRRALSDRLKNMRFMKRSEETNLRQRLLQEQKQREKEAHWTTEISGQAQQTTPIVLIEDGISSDLQEARVGRQSFGKFNKVFEHQETESNEVLEQELAQDSVEDVKPLKEEPPTLSDGITRDKASSTPAPGHRKIDLQAASRAIAKKRRRGIENWKSRKKGKLLESHHRNPE